MSEARCDVLTLTPIIFFSLLVSFVGYSLGETVDIFRGNVNVKNRMVSLSYRCSPGDYEGRESALAQSTERTCHYHWAKERQHGETQELDAGTLKGPVKSKEKEGYLSGGLFTDHKMTIFPSLESEHLLLITPVRNP